MSEPIVAKILVVQTPLRPAKLSDFKYKTPVLEKGNPVYNGKGEPVEEIRRKVGMTYYLMNTNDKMEIYTWSEETPFERIQQFIKSKRCYVIADVNWVDTESEIMTKEFKYIDQSVKQK